MTRSKLLKLLLVLTLATIAVGALSACKRSNGQTNAASASPTPAIIEITSMADIDDEVKKWLRKAYEMDA